MVYCVMVARQAHVEQVGLLGSKDRATRLTALKAVKNQVIGNKHKKLDYISAGAIARVVELLSGETDAGILVQAAATLGSFACGGNVAAVLKHGAFEHLVQALSHADEKVVESAVRSIKFIYQSCPPAEAPVLQPEPLHRLVALLGSANVVIAEAAGAVLAQCCRTPQQQEALTSAGAVLALVALLPSPRRRAQEAAAEGLAALTSQNAAACQQLLQQPQVIDILLSMLKDRAPRARLLAASTLAYLARHAASPGPSGPFHAMPWFSPRGMLGPSGSESAPPSMAGASRSGAGGGGAAQDTNITGGASSSGGGGGQLAAGGAGKPGGNERWEVVKRAALPVLLRLLTDKSVAEEVPPVVARLIEDSEELQAAASNADAIKLLAEFLQDAAASERLREGTLRALGTLCMNRDDSRRQLVEAKVLGSIASALGDASDRVRSAAALCITALTRSVRNLRSNLLEPDVAAPLCRLLSDPIADVQVNAAAAVCNLVLEFSSVKSAVLHHGGVQKLVELTGSPVATLRLHAAWALRNLLYQSDLALKQSVVRALPWPSMRQLLYDPEPPIQEQAVCILRNLCMSAAEHIQMAASWAGPDLMSVLEEKLDPTNRWVAPSMLVHALYTVVNILTGSEAHKAAVMLSNLPVLLLHHMRSSASAEVRLPTVWCVINLTWPEPGQDVASRTRRLKELGFEEALRALANDASLDVRERVKTALDQLRLSHAPAAAL